MGYQHCEFDNSRLPVSKGASQLAPIVTARSPVVQLVESKPFRWSQLESADYRTYIRNLKNIGCPETTLRAIVTADVNVAYRHCSEEAEQRLADLAGSSWSGQIESLNEQQVLKAKLQKLPDEEAAEIANLLGFPSPTKQVVTDAPTPHNRYSWQNSPIVNPLVFQNVDVSSLNLNAQQIEAIQNLRQSFLDEIGGSNQDPSDPAYRERWQKAQPEIDDMMRGMLGMSVFEDYQLAAQGVARK